MFAENDKCLFVEYVLVELCKIALKAMCNPSQNFCTFYHFTSFYTSVKLLKHKSFSKIAGMLIASIKF